MHRTHRTPIESTAVTSIGYDCAERHLEIRFKNGGVYEYLDVPADVYCQFLTAVSKGRYFNETIRERFAYRRSGDALDLS
jgi:hypothetical protein